VKDSSYFIYKYEYICSILCSRCLWRECKSVSEKFGKVLAVCWSLGKVVLRCVSAEVDQRTNLMLAPHFNISVYFVIVLQ
jgi:hypothetical protein